MPRRGGSPMEIRIRHAALAAALLLGASGAQAQLKIAYIDPLSGSFANVGEAGLKHFQAMAEEINAKGGVNGHNERNPGKEILYLNYAAVDPAFTNDKCSFWHFRFDANSDMKMEALTTW